MLKILLLLAIIVVAVLLVRNALKAAAGKRDGADGSTTTRRRGAPSADAKLVRCVACGAFVPKADAVVAGTGYRCGGAGCAPKP